MVEASLEESQESSPHNQTTRDSARATAPRPEPCGQSSRASVPDSTPSLEPEALLQITMLVGVGGVSTGYSIALFVCLFMLLNGIMTFAAALY
jgi:hypothetical protein